MRQSAKIQPRLTLVGAGPGDPELITLKGINALKQADAVLYDALVSEDLLDYAPETAIRVYVGKKPGNHRYSQEEINELIVEHAFACGHVVRLKGGDPFVFGRGHEELVHATALGIPTEVIPGISSAIAVPELQKIPLTRRKMSESFWVVTGTTSKGKLSPDVQLAARSTATVIILMGMNKLKEIATLFINEGKQNLPAAVIQNGTLPDEKKVTGTVATIAEKARKGGLTSPAIIILGEVVRLHPQLNYALVQEHYLDN